jgi:hypothetical protein
MTSHQAVELDKERLLCFLRKMLEIRMFEERLRQAPVEKVDGRLNYVISRLLAQLYPKGYFHYNRAMGVLASAMQEFYRRRVAPYEDVKISENGDVY